MTALTMWLVWGLIGLIGGYMTARLLADGHMTPLLTIIGIIGGIIGGWLYMLIGDPDNPRDQYISLLTSLGATALLLWPATILVNRHTPDD